MNIPAFQSAARAAGNAAGANPHAAQPRQQAAPPAPASNLPPDAARQPPEARPVLDLSDTALTRRDVPRGSFVDIIA